MQIQLTWHLILMIVLWVFLIVRIFTDSESGLDFSAFFYGILIVITVVIYGGIVWW